MLEQLFSVLELSESEVNVYLSLAELGKAPASLLAKKLQIPRSTAYTILENLLKRGLISIEQAPDTSFYVANQPESLRRMVEEEKKIQEQKFRSKSKAVDELLPFLGTQFKRKNYSVPKLQFFEGTTNIKSMLYDHCRAWQSSISLYESTWWGYQDHEFVETYREWLDYYWASMQPDEKIFLLSNHSTTEKRLKNQIARRVIKVVPKQYQYSSTVWVLGEYVITIMTRQKPHYAFQLQDTVFASNLRLTFQLLWNTLPA